MIFSAMSVLAFAGEEKSKTETFVASLKDGFTVETSGKLAVKAAVKDNQAAFNLSIMGFNAKVIMKGSSIMAYVSPLFKADVSNVIKELTGSDLEVGDFTGAINKIADADFSELTDLCNIKFENNVETFTVNTDKAVAYLKPIVVAEMVDGPEKQAILDKTIDDFYAYCETLPEGAAGKLEYDNIKKCGGRVTFTDSSAKTITNIEVTYPSEDFKTLKTIKMSDISIEGISVKSVSTEIASDAFDDGTGIFDVTWLVKLLINFVISKIAG